jgi:hypothetical protein
MLTNADQGPDGLAAQMRASGIVQIHPMLRARCGERSGASLSLAPIDT